MCGHLSVIKAECAQSGQQTCGPARTMQRGARGSLARVPLSLCTRMQEVVSAQGKSALARPLGQAFGLEERAPATAVDTHAHTHTHTGTLTVLPRHKYASTAVASSTQLLPPGW